MSKLIASTMTHRTFTLFEALKRLKAAGFDAAELCSVGAWIPHFLPSEQTDASVKETAARIADIGKSDIVNLPDAKKDGNAKEVSGTLYETDAALYFMSDRFINCHRLSSIVTTNTDTEAIHVLEHGREYTYRLPHADLFLLRSVFYHMAVNLSENKKKSLIYLASENTMTLTSGKYSVPKNIKSGVYWVNPVDEANLEIRDANGKLHAVRPGRVRIDEGSTLEVNGEYQFRYNRRKDSEEESSE